MAYCKVVPRPQRDFKGGFLAMLPKHALRLRGAKQPSSPKSGPAQSPRLSPKPSPKLSPQRSPIAENRSTGKREAGSKAGEVCHYRGTLLNGSEFDSSHKRGSPATFKPASLVPGFQEAGADAVEATGGSRHRSLDEALLMSCS
ncbi:fkpA [Symbiodinium necroappetens]|uniref:peptidylprolyl isomerase n=1 Tax=Symbiodinium necroappetens TaxID=1628268 RepID=A0A812ZYU2_9DINO|nr:fkpA [Symbiodinium necroappetens]